MYYINSFDGFDSYYKGGAGRAMTPWTPASPKVRIGDEEALVFTMRDLNQQTPRLIEEIQKTSNPAVITRHGRFIAVIRPLAPGQVVSEVLPEIALQVAKDSPVVRVGDEEALVFTMRDLNQQTARVIQEIEKAGRPAVITKHGRFIATITPLAPGQVESRILPEIARQIAKRD
jgi:antitoxin (DNA-binding transcriptional repressor) of toxin-antitoxin stability system